MSQTSNNGPGRTKDSVESASLSFEAVEPRVLFSATAIDPVESPESAHHSLPQVQEEAPAMLQDAPASGGEVNSHLDEDVILEGLNYQVSNLDETRSTQVVFISSGIFDNDYLASNLDPAYEVFLIDPGTDAIAQIAAALEGRTGINAVHLIGHGQEGRLFLGDTELNAESIQGQHRAALELIGSTLSADADILIYGCDFTSGEVGTQAAALLSSITGADVAASDDKTGNADLGGDWILETHFGEIEAESLALTSWRGILAPPTISTPAAAIVTLEDQPITFTGADLLVVGSDEVSSLTVTLSVTKGTLTLSGVSGITFLGGTLSGDSALTFSGTIADINTALDGLVYTPTLDSFGSDALSISVDDGTDISTSNLDLVVISQNDAPVLTVTPVNASGTGTPSETTPHTFTLGDFVAVDPDNSENQLTYILDTLPSVGDLRLNGHPVTPGSVFTQAQLASGALVYIHNGGEIHTDSFTLTVNDGAGGTDAMVVIPITVTAVNDAMSLSTEALVYEGGSTLDGAIIPGKPIPILSLSISDAESDAKSVRITSLPGGGTLYFNGIAITPTNITDGFSFAANLFNLLEYRHDGIDDLGTRPSDRSFTLEVTDAGGGAGVVETVNHTVSIKVVSVNDELDLVHLSTGVIATLGASGSYVLSTSDVEVNDPDGDNNDLTYTLISTPLRGDLYINGRLSGAGATFTQAQLNSGQVSIINGGSDGPGSLFFKVTDSSISILTGELGTLRTGDLTTPARILELQFEFTAGTGGGTEIRLEEAGSAPFPGLTAGDSIVLSAVPGYGQILINGTPLAVGNPYVYNVGDTIVYQHDGSHIDSDFINLTLNGAATTIPVKVILSNDAPILTILSTVTGIHEGSNGVITAAHLSAVDEETTDPALLIYTVIGSPSAGALRLNGNVIGAYGTFSHQDVIDGNVSYYHDGDERFLDSVTLQLSDGALTDIKTLNIQIIPVNDQPAISSSFLELLEGESKAFSSSSLGFYDVDGVGSDIPLSQDSPLQVRVDSLPAFGTLVFDDAVLGLIPVTAGFVFDYADISRLSYQHDSSENFSDSFNYTVIDNNTYNSPGFDAVGTRAGVMTLGIIPVNDAPAVIINVGLVNDGVGDRRVYEGGYRVLTPDVLGSSDPDSTNEQVQYRITGTPTNGKILLNGNPVAVGTAFSQIDLIAGRVSYLHNGSETTNDQFRFRIDDGSSNVSESTFLIEIISVNDAPRIAAPSNVVVNTGDYAFIGPRTISLSDTDAATADVTVTLTVTDPGGLLRVITTTGLTSVTGNDTSNELVLVGNVNDINAALATLRYRATDLDSAATLTIHVNDGGNTGVDPSQVPIGQINGLVNTGTTTDEQATRVVNLFVSPIDDAPVNNVPGPQTTYEDVNLVFSGLNGNQLSISDVDVFGERVEVTLSVSNGVITLGATTGLTFSAGDGLSDSTMTFRGTMAQVNAALQTVVYRGNANYEGSDALVITTNDLGNTGDGGPLSTVDNVDITVLGVNDAPSIAGPGAPVLVNTASFAFNGANTITISDVDIASGLATVTLTVDDPTGILEVTQLTGLTLVTGNSSSNTLTFTGNLTDVNNSLATLIYSPSDRNSAGTLTVLVSDNGNTGIDPSTIGQPNTGTAVDEQATRTFDLLVSDIDDAPVNSVPGAQTFDEDTGRVFSTANGNAIVISDIDAFGLDVTTTLSVTNGTLKVGGTAPQRAALTSIAGSGTNTLVLTGTIAEINAVLQGLSYATPLNFNGTDTLTIVTNDNGNTGAGGPLSDTDTVALVIRPVNDAPVNAMPVAQNVAEDGVLTFSTGNGNAVSVSDVDVSEGTGIISVTVGVSNGTLTLSGVTGLTFSTGDGTTDTTMTFTGTVAAINAALEGMTFNPVPDYNGPALLSLTTGDEGNFGSGGTLSDTDTVAITVTPVVDITDDEVTTLEDTSITFNVITGSNGATTDNFEGTPVLTAINGTAVIAGSSVAVTNGTVTVDATTGLLTFAPSGNFNGQTSFTYTVTSPSGVTETATATVNVTPVNDAPVNTVPGLQTFNEDAGRIFSTANGNTIAIADVDAATGDVTTTVSVTNGTIKVGGTAPQRAALTSIAGSGTNTLVLTGTIAEINAVLQGLSYATPLNFNGTDTLTIVTNDNGNTGAGGPLSDTDTVALVIRPVNDAPVNAKPVAQNVGEDGVLTFSAGNGNAVSVSDVDVSEGTGILSVTVGVSNGTLTLSGVTGLTFSTGDGTTDTTMTFTGTVAAINAALEGMTFNPVPDYNGPALLSLTTGDGGNFGSGGTLSDTDTVAITVTPVVDITDDEVTTLEDTSITFNVITGTNGATADNFEGTPVLTAINGTAVIAGSSVAVTNGTVSVDATTGLLTFAPTANFSGQTSFTYTVTSPTGVTETATATVNVTPVNDAPVNTVPGLQTFNEDAGRIFSTANGNAIAIADVDAAIGDVTTTVSVTNGTLTVGGTAPQRAALTSIAGSGTNTLVLTGTIAEINAVLQGLSYATPLNFNGNDTFTIVTNDNGNTGAGGPLSDSDTVDLTISPVNDAPVNTVPVAQSIAEDGILTFSTGNGNVVSVSDVDVSAGTGILSVTVGVSNGTLTLSGVTGLTFSTGDGTTDTTMTFTGTVAAINAALDGMTFNPVPDYNGPALLILTANDGGNFGSGGTLSDTDTVAITVTPVVDITDDEVTTLEDTSITFNVVTGTNGATADNFEGTPVLTAINGTAVIAGSSVAVTNGTVTVDATTGLLTFAPTANFSGQTSFTYTVTSPTGVTETATATVNVTPVNDAPVNMVPGLQTFNEDAGRIFSTANGNAISIADVDAAIGDVTTTVSVTNGTLTVGGTAPQRAALTSITGSGTNTLVLTGTIAEINAVLQGLSYATPLNFNGTDTLTVATNDNGNTGAGGPLSDTDTVNLTISPINDAPVNTVPAAQNVAEDGILTFSAGNGNAVSVSDVDVSEGTGNLTVAIGVSNGTLTLSGVTGLTFLTGDGTSDSTMTFNGTVAAINAALEGMAFSPMADYNGPALLTMTTNDGGNFGSGGTQSDTDTVAITVTPVVDITDDEVTTLEDTSITFNVITGTNGATADNFEGTPILTAINGTAVIAGSSVAITNGTVTVDATTGLLTFAPTANFSGQTSFTYTVTSPSGVTETATATVNVTPVNDAPVNMVPGLQTFNEDAGRIFSTANGNAIAIADVDAATGDVTTTVSVTNGTLTVGGTALEQAALTSITGSGTNTLVLTGTIAEINAVLQGLSYATPLNFNGTDTLTIVTNDNGNTGVGGPLDDTDTVALVISPVNDAPVNVLPVAQNFAEDGVLTFSAGNGNGVSVSDVDVSEGTGVMSVTVGVSNGTLTLSGVTGLTFSSGDGTTDTTMTFTGTVAAINAALEGMTFNPVPDYNGTAVFSLTTGDGGNFGSGGPLSDSDIVAITITPVVDITDDEVTTLEDTSITFNVITGTNGATVDNFEGTPVLTAINGTAVIAGSSVAVTNGTVTVDATTGLLTFTPSGDFNGQTSFTYTVTSPTGVTETATATVNVTPVNDAPVNTVPGLQTFNEDAGRIFSTANGNAIAITDVDAATGDVTTTVSVTTGTLTVGGTALEQADLTSITGSGTNILVLTGTIAEINAVLQGLSYASPLNFSGTDTLTIVTNDNGNTGAGGPLSDTDTVDLTISPVNDAPVNAIPGNQMINEDGGQTFSTANGNAISITDIDAATGDLTTTLTVSNGTLTVGGTASQQGALTSITGSGSDTLVLTGTVGEINAVLEGLVYASPTNFIGTDTLTIVTNDNGNTGSGGDLSDTDSFGITIDAVNDAPVNTVPGTQTFDEDTDLIFSTANGNGLSIADLDAASGDMTTTVTVTNGILVPGGSLAEQTALTSLVGSGTGTLVLTGTIAEINAVLEGLVYSTPQDFNGTDTLTITTNDNGNTGPGGPLSDQDTVSLVITPVEDAPTRVGTISTQANLDSDSISLDVKSFFTDVDSTDSITYTATSLPIGLIIDSTTGIISGVIDSSASGAGPFTVVVTADDGNGGTATQTFVWNVDNPAPVANNDNFSATQRRGATLVGNAITNNDVDPDGDQLTAVAQTGVIGSGGGIFSIDGNGNVTFDSNGEFDGLLGGETRVTTFSYTILDADGLSSSATVTLTVIGVSPPPVHDTTKVVVRARWCGMRLGLMAQRAPNSAPVAIKVVQLPESGTVRLFRGPRVEVGQDLTVAQLQQLVFDAPSRYYGNQSVRFVYSVNDGLSTRLSNVDIEITQSIKCYNFRARRGW